MPAEARVILCAGPAGSTRRATRTMRAIRTARCVSSRSGILQRKVAVNRRPAFYKRHEREGRRDRLPVAAARSRIRRMRHRRNTSRAASRSAPAIRTSRRLTWWNLVFLPEPGSTRRSRRCRRGSRRRPSRQRTSSTRRRPWYRGWWERSATRSTVLVAARVAFVFFTDTHVCWYRCSAASARVERTWPRRSRSAGWRCCSRPTRCPPASRRCWSRP